MKHYGLLVMMLVSLTACTTWKNIPVDKASQKLQAGDKVNVELASGKHKTFKVRQVTDTGIAGKGVDEYAYDDIKQIERKQFSALKTTGQVVKTGANATSFAASTTLSILIPVLGVSLALLLLL